MSISYETKTLIDSICFGVALGYSPNVGYFNTNIQANINNAIADYGSEILPLPAYSPPSNSYIENEYTQYLLYNLYDNGTVPSPFLQTGKLWIPGIDPTDYPDQYYGSDPFGSNNYYTTFNNSGGYGTVTNFYGKEANSRRIVVWCRKRYLVTAVSIADPVKPNYISLLSGYYLDPRIIPDLPTIISPITASIEIFYYRENILETIGCRTIDWLRYKIDVIAGESYQLPIEKIVLGTLYCSHQSILDAITSVPTPANCYSYSSYLPENIDSLFIDWFDLYNSNIPAQSIPTNAVNAIVVTESNRILHVLGATNNRWNNRPVATNNFNFDSSHPLFSINNQRAYDWHIKPQSDGSYGDLVMDSPRIIELHSALNASSYLIEDSTVNPQLHKLDYYIKNQTPASNPKIDEIHTALNAAQHLTETPAIIGTGTINNPQTPATHKLDWYIKNSSGLTADLKAKLISIWKALGGDKYGTNELDNTKERVTNLGFLVNRIAKVLGIRFDDNGKIQVDKEKSIVRKVIDSSKDIDDEIVGVNSFGDDGMVVKRINNRFKKKGIVSDQCVVVEDIPDLIQEYFEQTNLALGIQESSAIEIKQGRKAARFNNQLEVLIELVNLMSSGNEMTRAALVSSLVTQSQTNELIAGLGLPSVTKTIPIQIGKKVTQLPFKGIAAHRSISQEIATCTYNVGIATGQLL